MNGSPESILMKTQSVQMTRVRMNNNNNRRTAWTTRISGENNVVVSSPISSLSWSNESSWNPSLRFLHSFQCDQLEKVEPLQYSPKVGSLDSSGFPFINSYSFCASSSGQSRVTERQREGRCSSSCKWITRLKRVGSREHIMWWQRVRKRGENSVLNDGLTEFVCSGGGKWSWSETESWWKRGGWKGREGWEENEPSSPVYTKNRG